MELSAAAALSGWRCHDGAGGAGLDAHHADVVGDDVVQFAGDADTLGEHGLAGVLLPFCLQLDGPIGQFRPALAQRPDDRAEAPGQDEQHGVVGEQEGLQQRADVAGRRNNEQHTCELGDDRADTDGQHGRTERAFAMGGGAVDGQRHGEVGDGLPEP